MSNLTLSVSAWDLFGSVLGVPLPSFLSRDEAADYVTGARFKSLAAEMLSHKDAMDAQWHSLWGITCTSCAS